MSGKVIKEGFLVKSPPLEQVFANLSSFEGHEIAYARYIYTDTVKEHWKKRYFRLFESGRLDYYLNEHDNSQTSKGIINLLDCDCIEPIGHFPGRSNCIRVVAPNRLYIFQCTSQNDVRQWCEKLLSTRDNALGRTPMAAAEHSTENGLDSHTDTGIRSPVSSQANPSNDTSPPHVGTLQHDHSQLSPPPRPTKTSYSPQPARTTGYVPGQSRHENGGRKVVRQSTYTARSPWELHTEGDASSLDAIPDTTSRTTLSFDDFTIGMKTPQEPAVTSSSYHPQPQLGGRGDPDSDKYGYIPMQRQGGAVVDDEYERMAEQEIRPPSHPAIPPKSSPRPSRQSIATTPEFQPSPTCPRLGRSSVAGTAPEFETPDGYQTWSETAHAGNTFSPPNPSTGYNARPPQPPQRVPQKQTRRPPPRSTRNPLTTRGPVPPQKPRGISMRQF